MIVLHNRTLTHLVVQDSKVIIKLVGNLQTDFGGIFMLRRYTLARNYSEWTRVGTGETGFNKIAYVERYQVRRDDGSWEERLFDAVGRRAVGERKNLTGVNDGKSKLRTKVRASMTYEHL